MTSSLELDDVVRFYLESRDFNGLPLGPLPDGWNADRLRALVTDGLVQAVTDKDYPNMHIRPWSSKRSPVDQAADVDAAISGAGACCLYPTPAAMQDRDLSRFAGRPYAEAIARGTGVLDLAFFEMAAVEPYRNDPRYRFELEDFGFSFGIGDDAYLDDAEPEHDKIHRVRAGFGFPKDALSTASMDAPRYACALHADLWVLTPRHQQRLATWQVDSTGLIAHPIWWGMQMGHWPEHIGPFDKVLAEMRAINELWTICFGADLFRSTDRPRDWGWVLRPSSNEWDGFVLTTDKLLSDNLSKAALDAAGAPSVGSDGKPIGIVNRLEQLLLANSAAEPANVRAVLQPLRDVRKQRQRPAHAATDPLTDRSVFRRQRVLLTELADSLGAVRYFLNSHPKAKTAGWKAKAHVDNWLTL